MYRIIIILNNISFNLENLMHKIDSLTYDLVDFNDQELLNKLMHNLHPGYIRFRIISHLDYLNKRIGE